MALSDLINKLEGAVADLATLEVASFTGPEIDLSGINLDSDTGSRDLFDGIRSKLTTSTLVGYSRFEVEGDAMNYTNSDLGEDKKYLLENHTALVESGQKTRKDLFQFFLGVIGRG